MPIRVTTSTGAIDRDGFTMDERGPGCAERPGDEIEKRRPAPVFASLTERQGQFLKASNETTNYTVRTATRADVTDIHRLIVELGAATGLERKVSSTPEDFLEYGFADPPAFHALLAERDGKVVGLSLYFFTFSSWRGEPGVYLQDLVVAESARGTGLGRRLIAETARAAMAKGATHLRLSVDAENARARHFYRRCGLEQSLDERIYQVDGEAFRKLGTSV